MESRLLKVKIGISTFIVLIDILFFFFFQRFMNSFGFKPGKVYTVFFCLIGLFFITAISGLKYNPEYRHPKVLTGLYRIASFFIIFYLPKLVFIVFHIFNELVNLIITGIVVIVNLFHIETIKSLHTNILSFMGVSFGMLLVLLLIYGILIGRYHFKTDKLELNYKNLPVNFNGFRIVQISDLHLGSMYGKRNKLIRTVKLINALKPDLILFTGDLVNNFSEEALGWSDILSDLTAKHGKFSILGNHDYGDYWDWKTPAEKQDNLDLLFKIHKETGFNLLLNNSQEIHIGNDKIGILGVENWGRPPFHQYGNLEKANSTLNHVPFKILLSHDPTHWEEEVQYKPDIDLTLSGHTHAMQFGFKLGNYKWSPVQYFYKKWTGIYENNNKYLYVNRGLGYIGYMGRIGMRPEITLISLRKKEN